MARVGVFNHGLPRRYAHGQWLRFREVSMLMDIDFAFVVKNKVHGATDAVQQKALNDFGVELEAMWPVLACSHPRNECDSELISMKCSRIQPLWW